LIVWVIFGIKLLGSFLMAAVYSLSTTRQTDQQWQR